MKRIAITQREDTIASHQEIRDALDHRWMKLLHACQLEPLIIPNHLPTVEYYLKTSIIDGLLFTGGNHLQSTTNRDAVENRLLSWGIAYQIPILGVCRGMQLIQQFFGDVLLSIPNHVNNSHMIYFDQSNRTTNSFHQFGCLKAGPFFDILAKAEDGVIESIAHKDFPCYGIMWHPEREYPFVADDLNFIQEIFT